PVDLDVRPRLEGAAVLDGAESEEGVKEDRGASVVVSLEIQADLVEVPLLAREAPIGGEVAHEEAELLEGEDDPLALDRLHLRAEPGDERLIDEDLVADPEVAAGRDLAAMIGARPEPVRPDRADGDAGEGTEHDMEARHQLSSVV